MVKSVFRYLYFLRYSVRYSGEGYLLEYVDEKCVGVVLTCVGVSVGLRVCSLLFCVFLRDARVVSRSMRSRR